MAIQPIDLQTLFSQMDKVGKAQSEQKEGVAIQQSLQGMLNQKKVDERIRSVNEAQDTGDGPERIKDKDRKRGGRGGQNDKEALKKKEKEDESSAEEQPEVVTDPNLGRNIDLSG